MDVFELNEEERYGDEYPWRNPGKPTQQKVRRIKREKIREGIGRKKIKEI